MITCQIDRSKDHKFLIRIEIVLLQCRASFFMFELDERNNNLRESQSDAKPLKSSPSKAVLRADIRQPEPGPLHIQTPSAKPLDHSA